MVDASPDSTGVATRVDDTEATDLKFSIMFTGTDAELP